MVQHPGLIYFFVKFNSIYNKEFFYSPAMTPRPIASSFLKTFPYSKKNCYSKYSDSDSDSDSDGYGDGDSDGDRCHVTFEV